jgi:hypothetical protein
MTRVCRLIPNFAAETLFGGFAPPAAEANHRGVFHGCVYFFRKGVYFFRKGSIKSGKRVTSKSGNR